MITPNDIATKDFKKVAVGYSPEEVDTFLDDIYEDYERLYREARNREKAQQMQQAQLQMPVQEPEQEPEQEPIKEEVVPVDTTDRIQYLEKTIERTLTLAEAAAKETTEVAKAEAEQLIREAKLQAQDILTDARTKAYAIEQETLALENRYELMKTRVKLLLYAEIELLDKNEILGEKEQQEAPEIKLS